nr:DUF429 domain-containing protein [Coralloluteibacterium stylophorae]
MVGVDGAKSGWLAVWATDTQLGFEVHADVGALRAAHANAAVIAVDVPIGLSDAGPRTADVLARKFVGGVRASSIFSSPVRGVLGASSQAEASRLHRDIDTRGYGAQAFAILSKIREWDGCLAADAGFAARVHEVHPEVCFAALAGGKGLVESKKTPEGAARRRALLHAEFGDAAVSDLLARVPRRLAAPDDVLDALAALWSARRIAVGQHESLPNPPEVDSTGRRRAIHY